MVWSWAGSIVWKVSKYGIFSGRYFLVLGLNTGKYVPEKTPYLDTSHSNGCTLNIYVSVVEQDLLY